MSDRRVELERKKQRLAQMREEKERRRREKSTIEIKDNVGILSEMDIRAQTNELLESLGIPADSQISIPSKITETTTALKNNRVSPTPDAEPSESSTYMASPKKPVLSVVNVHQMNIMPKEIVAYNKQTQTCIANTEREETRPLDYYVLTYNDVCVEEDLEGSSLTSRDLDTPPPYGTGHHLSHGHKVTGLPNVGMVQPAQGETPKVVTPSSDQKKEKRKACDLSEDEKKQIMLREDFQCFFDRAARVMERALYENVDVLCDYSGANEDEDMEEKTGMSLSFSRMFYDEKWSKNRAITCFDSSAQFPELLAVSYNNNEDSPNDPEGVCLIFNMKFKKTTPEYVFHCQSAVTSVCFAKFHPNLLLGGTYSGQIVLWDNRSSKRTPVQRSPLSAIAHTHPVYSTQVVGTQNAHNLVSVSTDGKFCSWSLDMLSAPQDTMELSHQKQSRAVSVTSMSFPLNDFNNFIVGSEEGTIFSACRHGSKAGILDTFDGHQGPITSVDSHCTPGPIDFSHLFLSSSIDWTVKLWSLKNSKPLYSFEDNGDYVYNATWSPIHPAVFATVDGMGRLDVWNLNNDTELPTVSLFVEGNPALNRVKWTPNGHQLLVGDDLGKVRIYEVGEQLANPKNDEWSRFVHTLQELENDKEADQDNDSSGNFSLGNVFISAMR